MQAEPQTTRDTTYDTRIARFTSANLQTEDTAFGPEGHYREGQRQRLESRDGRDEKAETEMRELRQNN